MKRVYLDFETYYSKTYSLRLMTPIEYILGPEYETIMCAVCEGDNDKFILDGDAQCRAYFQKLDASGEKWMGVCHQGLFDMAILAYRYNVHPTLMIDTMGMARALIKHLLPRGSVSLDSVAKYLNLGEKLHGIVAVMGMHAREIKERGLWPQYTLYAGQDVDLCRAIYKYLAPYFPAEEHVIMDMVLRMATLPSFEVDQNKLYEHLADIQGKKLTLLERAGIEKDKLMSNDLFAVALQNLGVVPPRKISPVTGREAWAFAKTDEEFTDLQEHPDTDVQTLIAARLGLKSTLEETRTERMLAIGAVTEWSWGTALMPVPLRFSGAHTHRFSGEWKINLQNLPSRKSTTLRQALIAGEGRIVFAIDASQIEARLTAWLAGQWDLVEAFDQGRDIYSEFASDIYGYPVNRSMKLERLLGKICILGLGFGMGHVKFQATVRIQAMEAGFDIQLSLEEAKRIVTLYRNKYPKIVALWHRLNSLLPRVKDGTCEGETLGPCIFEKGSICLPNGLRLFYGDLRYQDGNWSFWNGTLRQRIYGGKVLENIVQALDRVCVMDAALRIRRRASSISLPIHLAHQVHDELIYVPTLEQFEVLKPIALEEMGRRPAWGPTLPLMSEGKIGPNYGGLVACQ